MKGRFQPMNPKNEHVHIGEILDVNGRRYDGEAGRIIGDVTVIHRSKRGNVMFTRTLHDHNDLLVTGAVFLSEKANNMRSGFITTANDVSLGVHTADQLVIDDTTIPEEKIAGIMVGNGGSGDTYNTVYKVDRSALTVPSPVPFRVVPVAEDLSGETRKKYFLRVVRGDYAYYYGKTFDIDREICVLYEDGTTVPVDADTSSSSGKFVRVFSRYRAVLDAEDIREFFKVNYGSTLRSLINSVGLVTGYPGVASDGSYDEFFNVRTMTTMNMENQELKDSESTVTFIYRLFIQ